MNEIEERFFEHEQTPYGLFAQGDMADIIANYKASTIGKFNQAELDDLNSLNNKNASNILYVTEHGKDIPLEQVRMNLGSGYVGRHNKSKHQFKNNLKVTPMKFIDVVHNTKERITARFPSGNVEAGQYIDVELDWKPLASRRKGLKCSSLIEFEPIWSKRMDNAIHPWDEYEN